LRVLGVVPARYGSTRFPGKALALLGGRPLVAHVIANARTAERLDRVIVATDDERIVQAARDAGAEAVMTPPGLPSGSDRVAHVLDRLARAGESYDAVF
jgi:3-deoxy-manno-octulosonate cytidylyltransferase (CMP-KDO synthetase)